MTRRVTRLAPALACLLLLGCGGEKIYRVSGKVTFKNQPVPAGKIYFMPDGSKGNTGPTGYADIKDGEYDTDAAGGRGAPSGPVIIAVEGTDPSAPPDKPKKGEEVSEESTVKLLFARYELKADLPAEASTKDIEVPAEAAKGPTQKKNPGEIVP
ncbi:MAG TPA: hypothetical protein VM529_05645 [Gemmata sp.]|nr:hypothetical protein [Gemmata sp.]